MGSANSRCPEDGLTDAASGGDQHPSNNFVPYEPSDPSAEDAVELADKYRVKSCMSNLFRLADQSDSQGDPPQSATEAEPVSAEVEDTAEFRKRFVPRHERLVTMQRVHTMDSFQKYH